MESHEIVPSRNGLEGETISSQGVEAAGQAVRDASIEGRALPSPEKQSTSDSPHVAKDTQDYLRYSSAVEIFQSNDVGSSPRRSLEHCNTAPVCVPKDLSAESHEALLFRSKTEKKKSSKHESRLDRLSEFEKKKLIVNLVKIQNDGTVEVDVTRSAPVASELLELDVVDQTLADVEDTAIEFNKPIPILKIAMLVVGTRGDVQPFLAMAKRLQEFGHHVRLATHANFSNFVRSAGIDFYPLGGDPRVLARYMARNKGFLPSAPGDISLQRKQMKAIINSLLPACTEPDMDTGAPFRAQAIIANPPAYGHAHVAEALGVPLHIFFTMPWTPTHEFPHPLARVSQAAGYRLSYFVVDLLIWWGIGGFVNDFRKRKLKLAPIAYFSTYHGSISHLPTGYMWSPHLVPKPNDWGPLVDVVGFCFLNLGAKYQPQKEFTQWLQDGPKPIYIGFGSMGNQTTAGNMFFSIIFPVSSQTQRRATFLKYANRFFPSFDDTWSMLPKVAYVLPSWFVVTFKYYSNYLNDLGLRFNDDELLTIITMTHDTEANLRALQPLEDAEKTTHIILEALKDTGQRGIIGRGWGDLGILQEAPQNVFLLDDCPHDWLFPRCSAVVHHGGAGTTATGLRAGCPTTIVPFFGDQFFWGDRVHQIGVGPAPIPISELTIESLSNAITFMLQPEVKVRAMELAKKIENEDGVAAAVDVFHRHLPEELPMPTSSLDENDQPYLLQFLFQQIEKVFEKVCCLPCS